MDDGSYWAQPRPPRERFDSVIRLWARAGSLFFDGFDFIFGIMLLVGVPAAAATLAAETAMADFNSLITIPLHTAVSSFFYAWISGSILYGAAIRLQSGAWPGVFAALKWMAPRWLRLWGVLFLSSLLFVFGLIAFVVPGLFLLVKLSLADAAVVYEPDTPAIQRSWELSRHAPLNIFLAIGPFLLASMLFTFGVDFEALRATPALAFAVDWSLLLLLSAFPTVVTALLYSWVRSDEDSAAAARLDA